jgi:hypothetical protein
MMFFEQREETGIRWLALLELAPEPVGVRL